MSQQKAFVQNLGGIMLGEVQMGEHRSQTSYEHHLFSMQQSTQMTLVLLVARAQLVDPSTVFVMSSTIVFAKQ